VWLRWRGKEGLQGPQASDTHDEEEVGAPEDDHRRRGGTARWINVGGFGGKKTAALEALSEKKMAAPGHWSSCE
jgi:hypothetical protein